MKIELTEQKNKENELALLWTLLNISPYHGLNIKNDTVISVMNAIEEKISRSKILNTIWKINYSVYDEKNNLIHKRHLND